VPSGKFGDWRSGEEYSFRANVGRQLTMVEDLAIKKRMEAKLARDAEREKKHEQAAVTVQAIWDNCQEADPRHPYLERKGVKPHGIRMTSEGTLVIPLYNAEGTMATLQYITLGGEKKYHPGGQAGGSGWWLGNPEGASKVYLAEGFATAATIFEETGRPVVIAYSAGNLTAMGKMIREWLPKTAITIVADNDNPNPKTGENTGIIKAQKAAESIGATVVYPPEVGTDANDYVANGGNLRDLLGEDRKRMMHADELATEPAPIKWLVNGWVQEKAMVMLHGPSGCGKSFVVIDWMCTIASGLGQWMGKNTKTGDVIYLCGEGHHGLRGRLAAWKIAHGVETIGPLEISSGASDLDNLSELHEVVQDIVDTGAKAKLIVIDTLNRFMSGDENSAQDTRAFLDACSTLMHEFECTVLIVHHTGLNQEAQDRARGSSAWKGAMDTEISVKSDGQGRLTLTQMKSKDGELQKPAYLELTTILIPGWFDEEGVQATSAVVTEGQEPVKPIDHKRQEELREVEAAWEYCGKEFKNTDPFINRKAWEDYLTKVKGLTSANARKRLSNDPNYLVGKMMEGGIIERVEGGFIVVDGLTSSIMRITNRNKLKPAITCDNPVISQVSQDDVEYEQPPLQL
jgi:KaiC/GvpD/RAD55 family RecA-like ATPase